MDKISINPKNIDAKTAKSIGGWGGGLGVAGIVMWWLLNQYTALEARIDVLEKNNAIYVTEHQTITYQLKRQCDHQDSMLKRQAEINTELATINQRLSNVEKKKR